MYRWPTNKFCLLLNFLAQFNSSEQTFERDLFLVFQWQMQKEVEGFHRTDDACFSGSLVSATEVCVVDCGSHGSCIGGTCHCEEGWTGPECEQRDCHPRCIDHGVCREGKCDCHQGWTGEHCTIGEPRRHTHLHMLPRETLVPEGTHLLAGIKGQRWKVNAGIFRKGLRHQIILYFCCCPHSPNNHHKLVRSCQ